MTPIMVKNTTITTNAMTIPYIFPLLALASEAADCGLFDRGCPGLERAGWPPPLSDLSSHAFSTAWL